MLIKKSERQARRGALAAAFANQTSGGIDRRTFLRRSGLAAGGLAALGALPLGGVRKAEAAAAGPAPAKGIIRQNMCTHCSVGCTVLAEVENGVWVGQEPGWDSPINRGSHCAKGAATRELAHGDRRLRYPMKMVGGQWQRISWDTAINEIGDKLLADPREVRARFGLLAGLGEVHQRGCLSQSQVRRVLGHEQLRPPGAHLPFDHRRRRSQHLGLRRDDQQLQRHPQRQDHDHHGRQSGRSASGVAAARARRQGAQPRQHDRDRSAPDAHGGARHRICPHPVRHRHPGDLGHALAHLQERLGGQGIHRAARLRHGRHPQGSREVDARRGRARHRRAGRAAQARRQDVRDREARDADLVHGRDPAHGRHRQRARVLHRAAGDRQCRQVRHRRQHLPRPHQRAGRDRPRPRYRDAAALLRPGRRRVEALVPRLGGRLRLDGVALRHASQAPTASRSR